MKLDGSTDAVNIGRGVGNRAGASSRLMRISSAKQLVWQLHFQKLFCMLHVMLAFLLFLFTNVFMDMIAMKPCTIFWSTTELSCIFAAVIWETESGDSLVTDMKFRWLYLYAQGYLKLFYVFTRWLQGDTLDGAGPIKAWSVFCLLFSWGFVDCSVRSSVLGSCMGVLTCTYFTHNKLLSIISALFFNPNLGFLPGSIWIWKKYQNLVFQVLTYCVILHVLVELSQLPLFFFLIL